MKDTVAEAEHGPCVLSIRVREEKVLLKTSFQKSGRYLWKLKSLVLCKRCEGGIDLVRKSQDRLEICRCFLPLMFPFEAKILHGELRIICILAVALRIYTAPQLVQFKGLKAQQFFYDSP
jgi:hypothetical protein